MPPLTARELECMHWAVMGKTSWEIGSILGLTERTINFHLACACEKLGVYRRQAAIAIALQRGLLPLKKDTTDDTPIENVECASAPHHREDGVPCGRDNELPMRQ